MKTYKRYLLIVEGESGSEFPLDMLRMEACVPARSEDVKRLVEDRRKLKGGPGYDARGSHRVVLNRFAPDGIPAKRDAWEKQGWIVVYDEADPRPGEEPRDGKPTTKVP